MYKTYYAEIKKCLISIFVLVLVISSPGITYSSPGIYLVGEYGYIEKLDWHLNMLTKGQASNLARTCSIRDADISPDGTQIFLAVSSDNPLMVMNTSDMSIVKDTCIIFPIPSEPWNTHFPLSIISPSDGFLYMTDESYSTSSKPFSTVLIDLHAKKAYPIYDYTIDSPIYTYVSPVGEKMALYNGALYFIDVPTGKIEYMINREIIGKDNHIIWFNVNWEEKITELYIAHTNGDNSLGKLCIDIKSHQMINQEKLEDVNRISFYDVNNYRKTLTSSGSKIYIQDGNGTIQIIERNTGKLLEIIDHTLLGKTISPPVATYISPNDGLLFYQIDNVDKILDIDDTHEISYIYVMDIKTKKIIKTLYFPQKVVDILFSE